MNRGLVKKNWHEIWLATLLFLIAFAALEALLLKIYPDLFANYQDLFKTGFMKNMLKAILGTEISDKVGPELPKALMWSHPILLAMLFGHAILLFTRIPAGEIGSGTIDILMSLPVSRTTIFLSNTICCLLAGLAIILAGFLSHLIVSQTAPPDYRIAPGVLTSIAANLYCLYFAVTGIISWVTSLCSLRVKAVGISFAILVSFDLIDYISQFWKPAKNLSYFTTWHYYDSLKTLNEQTWPWCNITILLLIGIVFHSLSLITFKKRNICTT